MSFYHRSDVVFVNDADGNPDWGASYTVTVYPVGAVASANSSGSTATVDNGHSINAGGAGAGDKVGIWDGTTFTFVAEAVSSVTATTIVWASATPSISAGDLIVNLGPDTASGATANFDASPVPIYDDADGGSVVSNSKVTADSTVGSYDYYYRGDGAAWEVIRDSTGTVKSVIPGYDAVAGRRNIVDYGASLDGTTDDSSRVRSTCLACSSTGGQVFVPHGTAFMNDVSANLSGAGTTLVGDGWASVLKAGSGHSFTGSSMVLVTADSTAIRNLYLDGDRQCQHCVEITGTRATHLTENCRIDSATIAGHRTQGAANVITGLQFLNNRVDDCDYGIYVVDTASSKIRILGNYFLAGSVADTINGVNMDRDAFDIIIADNQCETGGYGIAVASCTDVIIDGNHCTGQDDATRGQGIHLEYTISEIALQRVTVTNNVVSNVENAGIGVVASSSGNCKDVVIANNIVKGKASAANPSGINVDDVENLVIMGNTVDTFDLHGINVLATNSSTKNITIIGNICYNNNISANAAGANINIASSVTGVLVQGNRCYDDQGTATVRFHIRSVPTDGSVLVKDNFVDTNAITSAYSEQFEVATTGSPALSVQPGVTSLDSSGGAITATLGSGLQRGDMKTIIMTDPTTSSTVSVTNHVTSDPEVFTFAEQDDTLVLMWGEGQWVTVANSGVAV